MRVELYQVLLVSLVLTQILIVANVEAISLYVEPEHNSSDIVDVYFLFEDDAVLENLTFAFAPRMDASVSLDDYVFSYIESCKVSYDTDSKEQFLDLPQSVQELDPDAVYFSQLRIPTNSYRKRQYTNETMVIEMRISRNKVMVATAVTTLVYQTNQLHDTEIFVKINSKTRKATSTIDSRTPNGYTQDLVIIKVAPVLDQYDYKMRLDNFHKTAGFCTFEHMAGEIDLSAYNSLKAARPTEVDLTATELPLFPYMLPHGLIQITVLVEEDGDLKYEYRGYMHIERANPTQEELPFHATIEPWADTLWWLRNTSLNIRIVRAFFPSLKPYYGFRRDMSPQVQHRITCIGKTFCNFTQVSASEIRLVGNEANLNFVTFYMQWNYGEAMERRYAIITKSIYLTDSRLMIGIECIYNCKPLIIPTSGLIFRARCYNCNWNPWKKISFTWEFRTTRGSTIIESRYSKYLLEKDLLLKHPTDVFHLTLIVNSFQQRIIGRASKTIYLARDPHWASFIRFNLSGMVTATKRRGPYNTFHFNVNMITWSPIHRHSSPLVRCITRLHKDPLGRVELCTVGSQMREVAMYFSVDIYYPSQAEIHFAGETNIRKINLKDVREDLSYIESYPSIVDKCRAVKDSHSYGLSAEFALAQEIYNGNFSNEDIEECFNLVQSKLKPSNIHPARLKYSFKIQYMFFMAPGRNHSNGREIKHLLDYMNATRHRILDHYLLEPDDLENLARWTTNAANFILENMPSDVDDGTSTTTGIPIKNSELEMLLHKHVEGAAFDMMKLHIMINKLWTFQYSNRSVSMLWRDVIRQSNYTFKFSSSQFIINVFIPRQAYIDTFEYYRKNVDKDIVLDGYMNILVIISDTVYLNNPSHPLNHGSVQLMVQAKTSKRMLELRPSRLPIVIEFMKKNPPSDQVKTLEGTVQTENGEVVDSSCIIFSVLRNDQINLTLNIKLQCCLTYEIATIEAKHPTEYLKFVDSKFQASAERFTLLVPKVTELYKFEYPMSQYFILLRVKSNNRKIQNHSAIVESTEKTVVSLHGTQCFVLIGNIWKTNKLCKHVWSRGVGEMRCECFLHAPYSARSGSALDYYKDFNVEHAYYYGPNLVPASFMFLWLVPFLYYCYWASFQDRKEKDCAQTHVVRDMYKADSREQFLVCICTGSLPGSGTNSRVKFLLVGEFGSSQTVYPEGRFCFSTGSEVWFLVSSDLNLGHIVGVTLQYDKVVNGAELYPWFVKKVLLFSASHNHVIDFTANRTMGLHLRNMVLPSTPQKNTRTDEIFQRFWEILKSYHLIGSVILHVPGKGVSKVFNALGTMTVVAACSALALEVLGPPVPLFHGRISKSKHAHEYLDKEILIIMVPTFCLSILVKLSYSLIFSKRIGVIWYDKPQPVDGFWMGGESSPSWKTMSIFNAPREVEKPRTWLSDKEPLPREPRVNPKWLIRKKYFPQSKPKSKPFLGEVDLFFKASKSLGSPVDKLFKGEQEIKVPKRMSAPKLRHTRDFVTKLPEAIETGTMYFTSGYRIWTHAPKRASVDSGHTRTTTMSDVRGQVAQLKLQSSSTSFASHKLEFSDVASFFVTSPSNSSSKVASDAGTKSYVSLATSVSAKSDRSRGRRNRKKLARSKKYLDENINRCELDSIEEDANSDRRAYENASVEENTDVASSNQTQPDVSTSSEHQLQEKVKDDLAFKSLKQTMGCQNPAQPVGSLEDTLQDHHSQGCSQNFTVVPKMTEFEELPASSSFQDDKDNPALEDSNCEHGNLSATFTLSEGDSSIEGSDGKRFEDTDTSMSDSEISSSCFSYGNESELDSEFQRSQTSFGSMSKSFVQTRDKPLLFNTTAPKLHWRHFLQNNSFDRVGDEPYMKLTSRKPEVLNAGYQTNNRHQKSVTTFHQFYFKPVVSRIPKTKKWQKVSPNRDDCRFLRDARYLEKMVRDYGLDDYLIRKHGAEFKYLEPNTHESERCSSRNDKSERNAPNEFSFEEVGEKWLANKNKLDSSLFVSSAGGDFEVSLGTNNMISEQFNSSDSQETGLCICLMLNNLCHNVVIKLRQFLTFLKRCLLCGATRSEKNNMPRPCYPSTEMETFTSISRAAKQTAKTSPSPKMTNDVNQTSVARGDSWRTSTNSNQSALFKTLSSMSMGTHFSESNSSSGKTSNTSMDVQGSINELCAESCVDKERRDTTFDYFAHGMRPLMERWMNEKIQEEEDRKDFSKPTSWLGWARHCCRNFMDIALGIWSVKVYFLKIPIVLLSACGVIFSTGWVCANGMYYSNHEAVDWLGCVTFVLLVEILILEPSIFLMHAAISAHLWRTPIIITECVRRFTSAMQDMDYKKWMVELCLAGRYNTSAVHTQAAPESASLFYLHNNIYRALSKVIRLPNVVFESGVYWLIFYTACTLTLVNVQTSIYMSNKQSKYIAEALGLSEEKRPITVEEMWKYFDSEFRPAMVKMSTNSSRGLGPMMLTPVRIRQLRNKPFVDTNTHATSCSPLHFVKISRWRQCNYEFSRSAMENRNFTFSWSQLRQINITYPKSLEKYKRYQFVSTWDKLFSYHSVDMLPSSGYQTILHFDEVSTQKDLHKIRNSDWVDQHTRYLIIDFSLINVNSYIMSTIRIRFDFMRMAPFWQYASAHFLYEVTGNQFYFIVLLSCAFLLISAYNIIKEALLIYKMGVIGYLSRLSSYVEMAKVLLSVFMCVIRIQRRNLALDLLHKLRYYKTVRKIDEYLDFHEMAVLDYQFSVVGGVLGFICIFDVFLKLSKIRRLLIFIKLLKSVLVLFWMPLLVGTAFACLAQLLFSKTHPNFVYFGTGFLTITQYFVKPRPIYASLTVVHPYAAPCFYFVLGVCINFFMLNFFIVFLNEAYSAILNKVRLSTYKLKEKTKLEYVYEFLGIKSTITWDEEGDLLRQERDIDRDFLKDVKRLMAH